MNNVNTGALAMASLEGQMLGPYKVIAQMGSGGMATVYKAYQERLDRFVAIKMLHEAFQEDKNFLARFEREAKIVARLEHPHIVPVFDFDEFNGRPYLVMKYVEGHTLKAELDDMPLTIDEILRLMPPIASALDYAHRQGVLHRDIKPSNIIIDNNRVPYLTDFGLARMALLGDSTLSQDALLGTPHYISPEQAMGSRDLDSRTDLYSLGVVLFELVVGRVPFSADTPFAVIHDQIYRPLPTPSSINPDIKPQVDVVLEKALAKAPADRYATATEMVDAFRQAITQSGMTALKPDRVSSASESLAKLRDQQNQTPPSVVSPAAQPSMIPQTVSIPAPIAPSLPSVPAPPKPPADPFAEFAERDGGFPMVPTRRDVKKAKREARRDARRIIEAEFDFSNAGQAIEHAGAAVRNAIEGIAGSFEQPNNDPDLMPLDDPVAIRRRIEAQFNKRKEFFGHLITYMLVIPLLWIISGVTGILSGFPWPLIVMLGWGSGLAAHAIETYYVTGRRASRRLRIIQDEFYRTYGADWVHADRKELRRIRNRVVQPITKRREFVQHIAIYLTINAMLWIIYGTSFGLPFGIGRALSSIPFPWPLIVMLGWGIGLVANGFEALTASSRENAVQRAIERESDQFYAGEKPKRDRLSSGAPTSDGERSVRLTEDGEFTESMVDQIDAEEKAKRSQR